MAHLCFTYAKYNSVGCLSTRTVVFYSTFVDHHVIFRLNNDIKICGITHAIIGGFPANHSDFASHVTSYRNLLVPNFYLYLYVC